MVEAQLLQVSLTKLIYFIWVLLVTGGGVWKTNDAGNTWQNISDGYFGGSVGAVAVSESDNNVIYVGMGEKTIRGNVSSGDGIWKSENAGKTWNNITPKKMPEWMMINCIEIDPFTKGGAYIVGTKYKTGDYLPYIYKTENYGKSWKLIVNGIGNESFTRALRADPKRKGLLYAGTERGMYISFDDGENWQDFKQNLPIVPITDLTIKDDNLIAATQGRSLWIIDDLTPLHQLNESLEKEKVVLFKPKNAYNLSGRRGRTSKTSGTNHSGGVNIYYYIKEMKKKDVASISIFDAKDKLIKKFSTKPDKEKKEGKLKVEDGNNIFNWNMIYDGAESVKGMILWWASLNGPMALPGTYKVELAFNDVKQPQNFTIIKSPISENFRK